MTVRPIPGFSLCVRGRVKFGYIRGIVKLLNHFFGLGRRSGKCGWCTKKGVVRCDHSQHSVSFPKKWFKMLHLCPLPLTFMVRPGQSLVVNLNFFIFSVLPQGYVCDRYGLGVLTSRLVRDIKRFYRSVVKVSFWYDSLLLAAVSLLLLPAGLLRAGACCCCLLLLRPQ